MPLVDLTAPAGVTTEITDYQAGLRYTSADKVRFKYDQAEKIGGWVKRNATNNDPMSGVPRNIFPHRDKDGRKMILFGTSTHVYAEYANVSYDITPYKTDNVALTNPFATGASGTTITVTDAGNEIARTSPASRIVISTVNGGASTVTFNGMTITAGEYLATWEV